MIDNQYDQLACSLYTLKYLRDPPLDSNIRHFQNRVASYHLLRTHYPKPAEPELRATNDSEAEIDYPCGRVISYAFVYNNTAILSR